ncbi:hypothetical protein FDUTEX481_09823 [Tolypothrix sp. PCC 7601]|nr:hypothetical protein FDUTEX481_09823 [Tolypothrix sp. PCC 7601]
MKKNTEVRIKESESISPDIKPLHSYIIHAFILSPNSCIRFDKFQIEPISSQQNFSSMLWLAQVAVFKSRNSCQELRKKASIQAKKIHVLFVEIPQEVVS